MNYFRVVISTLVTALALYFTSKSVGSVFSNEPVIQIYGLLNIWGCYVLVFLCPYFAAYYIKEQHNLKLTLGNSNLIVLIIGLVLAPSLAIATQLKATSNVADADYVECREQREMSSRFSSRTYALNASLCDELKK